MAVIAKRTPTPRTGDTPIGQMMGYLQEYQAYLNYEMWAEGIRAVWLLDWWPLSLIEDALVGIVQWAYSNAFQGAYNAGADKGNQINNQIMGWVDSLRNEAMNFIGKLDDARIAAEKWLDDHEKRIKDLEKTMGLPINIPELLKWWNEIEWSKPE